MNQYDRLEELLKEKPWAQLSLEEKSWLGEFMSASEYENQRAVLSNSIDYLAQEPMMPTGLESSLLQSFRKVHHGNRLSIGQYIKPALAVAATVAVFFIGRWTAPTSFITVPKTKINTIYSTTIDTVILEKTKIVSRTEFKDKIIRDTVYLSPPAPLFVAQNGIPELMPILAIESPHNKSSKMKDQQEIYELLVDVY